MNITFALLHHCGPDVSLHLTCILGKPTSTVLAKGFEFMQWRLFLTSFSIKNIKKKNSMETFLKSFSFHLLKSMRNSAKKSICQKCTWKINHCLVCMWLEWRSTVLRWKSEDGIVPNMALQASVNSLCQQHLKVVLLHAGKLLETHTCDNLTSHWVSSLLHKPSWKHTCTTERRKDAWPLRSAQI